MGHHPSRRSAPFVATVLALVAALGLVGTVSPVSATPTVPPSSGDVERDRPAEMVEVDPRDFTEAGAELPAELQ